MDQQTIELIADSLTKPGVAPVFSNPSEFGMTFEDVVFQASDGVNLSGWLIKGTSNKIIIFSHFGITSSRSGYTPEGRGENAHQAEINYLKTFKHLVDEGYSVLTYDFRHHGNSDAGTNPWFTGGVEEAKDVVAAVDFISKHPTYKDSPIGLLSYCNGLNSTTYAFGREDGLTNYDNIKALFGMQPTTLASLLEQSGTEKEVIDAANQVNLARGGVDLYASFLPDVAKITVPTTLAQGLGDPVYSKELIDAYFDAIPNDEKEMLWLDGEKNRLSYYDWFNHSPEKMIAFFNKYL